MKAPLPISIVVPTYERNAVLRQALPSWLSQGVREILIVNDGGRQDPTEVLPREVRIGSENSGDDPADSTRTRVRVIDQRPNRGSPAARNAGADAARSPWILFVDDDVVLQEGHAATLFDHARRHGADLAAARRLWLRDGETIEAARARPARRVAADLLVDRRHIAYDDEASFDDDVWVPLIGAIMLVRREVACRVRYEETLFRRTGWREETDFQIRAQRAGARTMACPHTLSFHLAKSDVGRTGGQRAGRLIRYEWHLLWNNVRFLRRHGRALRDELGFETGAWPLLGALRAYFGFRVPSKLRHLCGKEGP